MNDSFRTSVFMKHQPETIACACIYLAARQLQIPLPESPPWYVLFEVEESDIRDICITLLNLYSRTKPNYDELEKIVEKAKKIQVEAKLKAKGLSSEYGTPNSASRQNSPKNISPNPSVLPGMKKVKLEDDHHSDASHGSRNHSKKRIHSVSDHSSGRSRSRSRSSRSTSSRSTSRSPSSRKKYRSPGRKYKKERKISPIRYNYKEKHSHKRKRRSRSRSHSRERYSSKTSLKKYYKEKDRGYSPERHRSRKHRNGHRASSRDRYDKYRR